VRIRVCTVAVLSGLLAAGPAVAATVQPGSGTLYISQGGAGYQPIAGPTEVNPGTQVMVSPGGNASLTYPDGCVVQVRPGEVTIIGTTSPCVSPYAPPPQPTAQTPDTTPWLIAGAVVLAAGAGVGIYYAISP
jgi:hypothetical protein